MTKRQHTFYTLFKNVPYSDKEWEQTNEWRRKLQENPHVKEDYKQRNQLLKTRPCHSTRYGDTVFSLIEARNLCEAALRRGAQAVQYSIYGPNGHQETWACWKRKNKVLEWRKVR